MRENRAAKFGKQANREKRGKTSIRHRNRVNKQQKNIQTNKDGGAKKGKRRHECKANFAYECIKRFQNCFLACSRLFLRRGLAALFLTYWMPCSEYRDVQMSLSEEKDHMTAIQTDIPHCHLLNNHNIWTIRFETHYSCGFLYFRKSKNTYFS